MIEGVPTAQEVDIIIKRLNLNCPIFRCTAKVLRGEISPQEAMWALMSFPLKEERFLKEADDEN